jgi:IMP dehydrogenase
MSALDYGDVSLVSRQVSTIKSRDEIDTSVEFCGRKLSIPIVASPMLDVCDGPLAKRMMDYGAFGIIHRFSSIAQQVSQFRVAHGAGCAIGINGDWNERFQALYKAGCRIFCLDVANGASFNVLEVLATLHTNNCYSIVGNTVSREGYKFLAINSANAVRVGVAGGAGCTTKNATGIYHPMLSLLEETYIDKTFYGHDYQSTIIADGGIKEPSDFCKAIAFGADVVMLGSLIANTTASPAERLFKDGKHYTVYRGSASLDVQSTYKELPRYIEGRSVLLDFHHETLENLLKRFMDGLRSSMSYFNARNLKEYRENMNYVTLK